MITPAELHARADALRLEAARLEKEEADLRAKEYRLKEDQRRAAALAKGMNYLTPVGLWEVTTEGDCEGRTTRHLGTFEGHVADIARLLSREAYYSLKFRYVTDEREKRKFKAPAPHVAVGFDIGSNTWDMSPQVLAEQASKLLAHEEAKNNNYRITAGGSYAGFTIHFTDIPEKTGD